MPLNYYMYQPKILNIHFDLAWTQMKGPCNGNPKSVLNMRYEYYTNTKSELFILI